MWILTTEYNQYDQEGAYFVDAWDYEPSVAELMEHMSEKEANHCLTNGGGRIGTEYQWFHLFNHKPNGKK